MALQYEYPDLLWLIPFVLCLSAWFFFRLPRARFERRKLGLFTLAVSAFIVAFARPQMGDRVPGTGAARTNVFFAVDISQSMTASDISPSRLAFAQTFGERLVEQMPESKFAIFPFNQDGYLQVPLTDDPGALDDALSSLMPSQSTDQGTDITASLKTLYSQIRKMAHAVEMRGEKTLPSQVVLLSDGESHESINASVLREFKGSGIPIYSVAIGTSSGANITYYQDMGIGLPGRQMLSPRTALTKLDLNALQTISAQTGGETFPARLDEANRLAKRMTQASLSNAAKSSFKVRAELYPAVLTVALLLLLVYFGLGRWQYAIRAVLMLQLVTAALWPRVALADKVEAVSSEDSESRAIELYDRGIEELGKQPTKALDLFEQSASLTEDPVLRKKALYNLGNTLMKLGDPKNALAAYQMSRDTKAPNRKFEADANRRISDNMELAMKEFEQQQKSRAQQKSQDGDSNDQNPNDPKGPRKFQGEEFSEREKQRMYDQVSTEERQTLQRLQQDKNGKGSRKPTDKPW